LGDRLAVIPEGVSEEFFKGGMRSAECEMISESAIRNTSSNIPHSAVCNPYFLWAGSLNPRKNLARVIDAFEQVAPEVPHHLVITGGSGWDSDKTLARIRSSPLAARIHLCGHVSDEDLRTLYHGASGFLYVSLMEGFGLPILEAMACGCPVITSNVSSMPEVAGDAAFLVNPLDTNEIAEAIHCVATDPVFARGLSARGRARPQEFHWDSCALAVAEIYQRVAQDRLIPKAQPGEKVDGEPTELKPAA